MDYPLENLGPEKFQLLCQSLIVKEFPATTCYPVGQPDGGRDASQYLGDGDEDRRTVFQVKFSKSALEGSEARSWVLEAAKGEVEKVQRLKARGATNYIFITNVPGTAHLDVGSMDRILHDLQQLLDIPVTAWWRDDINRRLDGNWDIKLRFPEVLSGQDYLRLALSIRAGEDGERRLNALRAFLASQYEEDEEVRFKQVELQNRLLELFIDLPFSVQIGNRELQKQVLQNPVLARLLRQTEHDLLLKAEDDVQRKPGTAAALLLSDDSATVLNQVVVEGAPGQGKSTLVQYLCQVHRIRWLAKTEDLKQLPPEHQNAPVLIPFKVDLRDLAEWVAGVDPFTGKDGEATVSTDRTLETFLARLVNARSGGIRFDANDLIEIAKDTPLFLALDGLDEVADIRRRADTVNVVSRSIVRLRENCRDMRVVITSRPAAFANSPGFDRKQFPLLQLGSVQMGEIRRYAEKWMDARRLNARERAEFNNVLDEKLKQPHLRDLSRNPMQLAILLSLILTKGSALPDQRTALYYEYIELFFGREATKHTFVRAHLDLLKDIHRYLAWVLHSEAELGGNSSAAAGRLTSQELKDRLKAYLVAEGRDSVTIDEVFNVMLERVVMIVSRIQGTHEFEVQPLREYFAAKHLDDTAPLSTPGRERPGTKIDRFDAIARNFYWLNVTRFFCGCFSKGELFDLALRVQALMDDPVVGQTRHPTMLAAMLLSDRVFTQSPAATRQLASLLATSTALRNLSQGDDIGRTEVATIPESCGGAQIVDKAFEDIFSPTVKSDVRRRLAKYIVANAKPEDRIARWLGQPSRTEPALHEWLSLGAHLGCLGDASAIRLSEVLKGCELSEASTELLWRYGIGYVVPDNEHNWRSLEGSLLDGGTPLVAPDVSGAPLYLVADVLESIADPLHLTHFGIPRKEMFRAISQFRSRSPTGIGDYTHGKKLRDACMSFSERLAARTAGLAESELGSMHFGEEAVDELVSHFGERPTIIAGAISIVLHLPSPKGRPPRLELLDSSKPLCGRMRFAKSQAAKWQWWEECLKTARTEPERSLFHSAFWALAQTTLILEHAESLGETVDAMSDAEWLRTCRWIRVIRYWAPRRTASRKGVSMPFTVKSARLSYLLALRDAVNFAYPVFVSHFLDSDSRIPEVMRFRQLTALQGAVSGALPWNKALSIIRATYREDVAVVGAARVVENSAVPQDVVQTVFRNPEEYPADLWEAMQDKRTRRVLKSIRPVAHIAAKEGWFEVQTGAQQLSPPSRAKRKPVSGPY